MPVTLYCDEHFGSGDVERLEDGGKALGLRAELFSTHNYRAQDQVQMRYAAERGWTILTRDRDFTRLQDLWCVVQEWRPSRRLRHHAGILWIASSGILNHDVVAPVVSLLETTPEATLRDGLFVLEQRGASWRQYRPFG